MKKIEYTYENKLDYSDEQIKKLRKQEREDVIQTILNNFIKRVGVIETIIDKYWDILPKEVQEEIQVKFYKNGGKNNDIR